MKSKALLVVMAFVSVAAFAGGQVQKAPAPPDYTDTTALERLIEGKTEPYILVDVRTPEEYASGHIPTAINIPVTEIGSNPPTQDKSALIILYCRSGNRSGQAQAILQQLGYTNVVNYGAVANWRKPLVLGDKPLAE